MILPVVAYGDPVLRRRTEEISQDYPELENLIENMFETMYAAPGVGLAAPQIGLSIRLFIVDSEQLDKEEEEKPNNGQHQKKEQGIREVFINPNIIEETGKLWP